MAGAGLGRWGGPGRGVRQDWGPRRRTGKAGGEEAEESRAAAQAGAGLSQQLPQQLPPW